MKAAIIFALVILAGSKAFAGSTVMMNYYYSAGTSAENPQVPRFSFDALNLAHASSIRINHIDADGKDQTAFIDSWVHGQLIVDAAKDGGTTNSVFLIAAPLYDYGDWTSIPIVPRFSTGSWNDGDAAKLYVNLTIVPEPATIVLGLAPLVVFAVWKALAAIKWGAA